MKLISSGNSGKNEPFGAMGTFVVRLAMPVRRPSAATLLVKGEMRRFIHEAEDLVVFAPDLYKTLICHKDAVQRVKEVAESEVKKS